MATIPGRSRKGATNDMVFRDTAFPGAANRLWEPVPSVGYVMIPKTLPFIVRILDEITKGKPVGRAYSVLWTFCWNNDAFIKMSRAKDIAYACGYTGPRGVRLLNERLAKLAELGMIETKSGTEGDISFVFLPSPHYSLLKLWVDKKVKIQERSFISFCERATAMGAKDVIAMLQVINSGGTLSPITVAPPPAPPAPAAPIFPTTPPPPRPGTPPAAPVAPVSELSAGIVVEPAVTPSITPVAPPQPIPSTDIQPDELQKLFEDLGQPKPTEG